MTTFWGTFLVQDRTELPQLLRVLMLEDLQTNEEYDGGVELVEMHACLADKMGREH